MVETNDRVPNNVYTVLLLAAVLVLTAACAYVWLRNTELTGQSNPFHLTSDVPSALFAEPVAHV